MRFIHRFAVDADIQAVAEFHSHPGSMARITPPPIQVRILDAPNRLKTGSDMSFTLGFGPIRMHWRAEMPYVGQTGFVDRQVEGLFGEWEHRHIYVPISSKSTMIIDDVHATLSDAPAKRILGALMWLGMPVLFTYRGWMTRRILSRQTIPQLKTRLSNPNTG